MTWIYHSWKVLFNDARNRYDFLNCFRVQSIILEGKNAKAVGYVEGEPVDEGVIKGFSKFNFGLKISSMIEYYIKKGHKRFPFFYCIPCHSLVHWVVAIVEVDGSRLKFTLFDPGLSLADDTYNQVWGLKNELTRFKTELLKISPGNLIECVDSISAQPDDTDTFCQSWSLWFAFAYLVLRMAPDAILRHIAENRAKNPSLIIEGITHLNVICHFMGFVLTDLPEYSYGLPTSPALTRFRNDSCYSIDLMVNEMLSYEKNGVGYPDYVWIVPANTMGRKLVVTLEEVVTKRPPPRRSNRFGRADRDQSPEPRRRSSSRDRRRSRSRVRTSISPRRRSSSRDRSRSRERHRRSRSRSRDRFDKTVKRVETFQVQERTPWGTVFGCLKDGSGRSIEGTQVHGNFDFPCCWRGTELPQYCGMFLRTPTHCIRCMTMAK